MTFLVSGVLRHRLIFGIAVGLLAAPVIAKEPVPTPQRIIHGGMCLVIGCQSSESLIDAVQNGKYQVQAVCSNKKRADEIRKALADQDVDGNVSVTHLAGTKLPHVDNLVNLVVVQNTALFDSEEIMRVVAPLGVMMSKNAGEWTRTVKSYPKEMDQWPQSRHDAAGSTVSLDTLVAPPTRLQWTAQEKYPRETMIQLLSAGGRNFYCFASGRMVARDAFNGTWLWEQSRVGRPVAATHDYVCSIARGKLVTIDAATGEVNPTDVAFSRFCTWDQGTLFASNAAYHLESKRFLWQDSQSLRSDASPLVVDDKVIFSTRRRIISPEIVCRHADTGEVLWRIPATGVPVMGYRGKLLLQERLKEATPIAKDQKGSKRRVAVHCLDLNSGRRLWTLQTLLPQYRSESRVFCFGDSVWVQSAALGSKNAGAEVWRSYKLETGAKLKDCPMVSPDRRCLEPRATRRFLMGVGPGYWDHETGGTYSFLAARPDCVSGTTPANGMQYQYPNRNRCLGQIDGVSAVRSRSIRDPSEDFGKSEGLLTFSDRLEVGPAYGEIPDATSEEATGETWPTLRGGHARWGSNLARIPTALQLLWQRQHVAMLSSPVADHRMVYGSHRNSHFVTALDASTGKPTWTFVAEGPVDSPPTVANGAVVFGDEAGWIYVLRSTDGELAWRFHLAPAQRTIVTNGQFASAWPCHGSLLVQRGIVYAVAGHHNELDGGLFACALEQTTGKLLWRNRLARDNMAIAINPRVGEPCGNTILATDGKSLFMETMQLDIATGKVDQPGKCETTPVVWGGPHGYLLDPSMVPDDIGPSGTNWKWRNVEANMLAVDGEHAFGIITMRGKSAKRLKNRSLFEKSSVIVFCAKRSETPKKRMDVMSENRWVWKQDLPSQCIARAILRTRDQVIVACTSVTTQGKSAGLILQYVPETGKEIGRVNLSSPPRWDGLAAAGNRLYVVTEAKQLLCLGAR